MSIHKRRMSAIAVDDSLWCARIGDASGKTVGDAKASFDLPQRQHAAARGELAAVETGDDRLAADR